MDKLQHLAIIMDGNGRWASRRGLPRNVGHRQGIRNVDTILKLCIDACIPVLSLYVFSTENWKRPKEEVDGLLKLVEEYFCKLENYDKLGVKILVSGSRDKLSKKLIRLFDAAIEKTAGNNALVLNLCFNYGGKEEIISAVNTLLSEKTQAVTEETFCSRIYTGALPEVDYIIRTGGQKRLSNFLLFKSAYAELCFVDCLWPDFGKKEFNEAIEEYYRRVRNFGSI